MDYKSANTLKMMFGKMSPGKNPPGKKPPRKLPLENYFPENCLPEYAPRKIPLSRLENCIIKFLFLLILSYGCSRTPATSMIDLLVTVVNCIIYCRKKLLFRCCGGRRFTSEFIRWSFSKIFISKVHISASDKR